MPVVRGHGQFGEFAFREPDGTIRPLRPEDVQTLPDEKQAAVNAYLKQAAAYTAVPKVEQGQPGITGTERLLKQFLTDAGFRNLLRKRGYTIKDDEMGRMVVSKEGEEGTFRPADPVGMTGGESVKVFGTPLWHDDFTDAVDEVLTIIPAAKAASIASRLGLKVAGGIAGSGVVKNMLRGLLRTGTEAAVTGAATGGLEAARQGIGAAGTGDAENIDPAHIAAAGTIGAATGMIPAATRGGQSLLDAARPRLRRALARGAQLRDIGPIQEVELLDAAMAKLRGERKTGSNFYQLGQRLIRELEKSGFNPEATEAAELAAASKATVNLNEAAMKLHAAASSTAKTDPAQKHILSTYNALIRRVMGRTEGAADDVFLRPDTVEKVGVPDQILRTPDATRLVPNTPEPMLRPPPVRGPLEAPNPSLGAPLNVANRVTVRHGGTPPDTSMVPVTRVVPHGGEAPEPLTTEVRRRLASVPMPLAQDLKRFLQEEAEFTSAQEAAPDSAIKAIRAAAGTVRRAMDTGMAGVRGPSGRPFTHLNRIAGVKNELRNDLLFRSGERSEANQAKRFENFMAGLYRSPRQADRDLLRRFEEVGLATKAPVSGTIRQTARAATIDEALGAQKEGIDVDPRLFLGQGGVPARSGFLRIQPSPQTFVQAARGADVLNRRVLEPLLRIIGSPQGTGAISGPASQNDALIQMLLQQVQQQSPQPDFERFLQGP